MNIARKFSNHEMQIIIILNMNKLFNLLSTRFCICLLYSSVMN